MTSDLFVRSARTLLRMTQTELADTLDISRFTVGRYEQGEPVPKAVQLAIIHLLAQHNVKPDHIDACVSLPNPGRHKPPRQRKRIMQRIYTEAQKLRRGGKLPINLT